MFLLSIWLSSNLFLCNYLFISPIDYFNYLIDLFSSEILAILLSTNSKLNKVFDWFDWLMSRTMRKRLKTREATSSLCGYYCLSTNKLVGERTRAKWKRLKTRVTTPSWRCERNQTIETRVKTIGLWIRPREGKRQQERGWRWVKWVEHVKERWRNDWRREKRRRR